MSTLTYRVLPKTETIPSKCPECGRTLHHVNAVGIAGLYAVFCLFSGCRWCDVFRIGDKKD